MCLKGGIELTILKSFEKPLTPEEEVYYLTKFKLENDESSKEILIERNMRLVAHIAKNTTILMKTRMILYL